jgi:antibiotic biosynthesis monooxygenase (ABM) superfamily enzyme
MHGTPILLVSHTVDEEQEAEFNDFIHHTFIPASLRVIPEFISARRYVTTADDRPRRYLTLYEFASEDIVDAAMAGMARPGREAECATLQDWETNHVHDLTSVVYFEIYQHRRIPPDGMWGTRPMYLVTYQVRVEQEPAFSTWYEGEYIPRLMADVPAYAACRRYTSQHADLATYLTVYEIDGMPQIDQALADMGSPSRRGENQNWHHWEEAAVPAIEASVYRPIFSWPV